jgi:hypothetical protein
MRLRALCDPVELKKIQRYFKSDTQSNGDADLFIGVRMGLLFDLAKEFITMPIDALEVLLKARYMK